MLPCQCTFLCDYLEAEATTNSGVTFPFSGVTLYQHYLFHITLDFPYSPLNMTSHYTREGVSSSGSKGMTQGGFNLGASGSESNALISIYSLSLRLFNI